MHKNDYREKFNKNNEVLKKLNIILDKTKNGVDTGFTEDTIKSAIEKINNEQNFYSKQMRKNMYQRFNGKIKLIPNYELYQPEFIERENEIIIQANSIDEYVTEVVENNQENEIEMSTTDKTCDDKTDVLTSVDKTDVLTSDDKTCDDKTDVLTSSNKVNISKKKVETEPESTEILKKVSKL